MSADWMESVYQTVTAMQPGRLSSVTLVWNPHDPLAVTMVFPRNNWWVIDRDLLITAVSLIHGTVGEGDVRFHSYLDTPDSLLMELDSPSGWGVVRLRRSELGSFLDSLEGRKAADPLVELDKWLATVVPS